MNKTIFLGLSLASLAACGGPTTSPDDVLRNHGYSENYISGHNAGCESGKHAGGEVFAKRSRNEGAYASGGDYATGWDYGFVTCKQQQIEKLEVAVAVGIGSAIANSSAHGADGVDAKKALEGIDTSGLKAAGW